LHELDLDYVYEDFVQRGILKDGEKVPAFEASSEGSTP
jgi:hypothetical protein